MIYIHLACSSILMEPNVYIFSNCHLSFQPGVIYMIQSKFMERSGHLSGEIHAGIASVSTVSRHALIQAGVVTLLSVSMEIHQLLLKENVARIVVSFVQFCLIKFN